MAEAYCGPAPAPEALLAAWNADAVAVALCAALALAHARRGEPAGRWPLGAAILLILALFLSPLCALTVALFSARVAHHVLLVAVAAPLLALAFPERADAPRRIGLSLLVAVHTLVLWLWHAPPVYEVAIRGALPYWTMQASLLASAVLLWRRVLAPRTGIGPAALALLATVVQMGMLGALLTFARDPLYAPHLTTTLAYSLSPRADQQLGGLIMWVPAALPYLVAAALLIGSRLERPPAQAGRR
ncbi:MAG: cytochrome c oxidase assembly protein [Aquamicrobium sp.]|uniref:cytochrome c oxidase assembly protein n=1 Tax=Aquamicrobium sp. TaxID=1872579 RepID=UPI00349EADC8|nr:cytochrome c oxidase assembly protein [Aquamicrobium sp.]